MYTVREGVRDLKVFTKTGQLQGSYRMWSLEGSVESIVWLREGGVLEITTGTTRFPWKGGRAGGGAVGRYMMQEKL